MNASMDAELAVSSVSTDSWETEAINKWMVGKESYRCRYSIWIEALALLAYSKPLVCNNYIKCCSVDWCSCINTSVNNAISYIVAFFNYKEAVSLLRLTKLTLTGFQESCKVCHLLECPFNSLRAFYSKQWKYSLQIVCSSISQCLFTIIISTRTKGKFIIMH